MCPALGTACHMATPHTVGTAAAIYETCDELSQLFPKRRMQMATLLQEEELWTEICQIITRIIYNNMEVFLYDIYNNCEGQF